jgi:hypothetical protein
VKQRGKLQEMEFGNNSSEDDSHSDFA